jgi:lycopene cyclase domain-containing protein
MFWYAVGALKVFQTAADKPFFMKSLYLLINLGTILIPFLFSFHPRLQFNRYFKAFFLSNLIVGTIFIIWDIWFTKIGVWGFNENYLTGISLYNLPIEEVLFFICIPFACVFTYHCLTLFYSFKWNPDVEKYIIWILAGLLFLGGLYFYDRWYTAVLFISLSLILLAIKHLFQVRWLSSLMSVYVVLLIPFFIVNGLLTGSGLDEPVVWYNPEEHIGLRLWTIPVEDIFYGFELILLNVFFYERLKTRFTRTR